jgi:3-hydroxyisobutyrate dehydrogenase/glyoxylate/succinic semialdehyde reductase
MTETVGFIGLGMMGKPMAERILEAGYRLVVFNRTRSKATPLLKKGAVWADSPRLVGQQCTIVFSMISSTEVLADVALGVHGLLRGFKRGSVHVDMSTVSPEITKRLQRVYKARGSSFMHCPVLGSVPQATDGSLLLFPGGSSRTVERVKPILTHLGHRMWRFDRVEQATHTKLLCNMFIAGMIMTLTHALAYARKANVPPATLLEIIAHSALNAPMYQTKGKAIIEGKFTPRFFVEHMLKDIRLMLDAANELKVPLPVLRTARKVFERAVAAGYGKEDYSAVIKVLDWSNYQVRKMNE